MPKKKEKPLRAEIIKALKEINNFIIKVQVDQPKLDLLKKPLAEYIADQILELVKNEGKERGEESCKGPKRVVCDKCGCPHWE